MLIDSGFCDDAPLEGTDTTDDIGDRGVLREHGAAEHNALEDARGDYPHDDCREASGDEDCGTDADPSLRSKLCACAVTAWSTSMKKATFPERTQAFRTRPRTRSSAAIGAYHAPFRGTPCASQKRGCGSGGAYLKIR